MGFDLFAKVGETLESSLGTRNAYKSTTRFLPEKTTTTLKRPAIGSFTYSP